MNKFSGAFKLDRKVVFTVPGTVDVKEVLDPAVQDKYGAQVALLFSQLFGGATVVEGKGHYYSSDLSENVEERVLLISSSFSACGAALDDKLDQVHHLAVNYCRVLTQECIAVEIDGDLHFVSPEGN